MARPTKDTCLRGHNIADVGRYANGECMACGRERRRLWRAAHYKLVREADRLDRRERLICNLFHLLTWEERNALLQHPGLIDKLVTWKRGPQGGR